jgi:hypothetical protein
VGGGGVGGGGGGGGGVGGGGGAPLVNFEIRGGRYTHQMIQICQPENIATSPYLQRNRYQMDSSRLTLMSHESHES